MAGNAAALGLDVGGTTTKAAIVTRDGKILSKVVRPTDRTAATKGIIASVEELLGKTPDVKAEIVAIGIGAAGFISADTVIFSPNLTFDDPQIGQTIRSRFDLPVVVDNDANAAAWGEYRFGAAAGARDLILLMIGTGLGSGVLVDGRLLHGHSGAAAEFGHTVIDPNGPPCTCGLRGCIEQFVAGAAIVREARIAVAKDPGSSIVAFAGSSEEITAEHVGRAAREYDETAREVLRRAGTMLGIGLSNLANLFDPEVLILGGGVVQSGEPLLGPARDELTRRTNAQRRRPMRLDVSKLGSDGGCLGAAALAWEQTQ